jgi:hypothetical protein
VVPEGPPFPDELEYLWKWFNDLSLGIAANGMAPVQVTWIDVEMWAAATKRSPTVWEKRALVTLGFTRARVASEEASKSRPKTPPDKPGKTSPKPRRR